MRHDRVAHVELPEGGYEVKWKGEMRLEDMTQHNEVDYQWS